MLKKVISIGFVLTVVVMGSSSKLESKFLKSVGTTQAELVELINKQRAKPHTCGEYGYFKAAGKLVWNQKLHNSAFEHSKDLAISNTFDHLGSGEKSDKSRKKNRGSLFYERILNHGYKYHKVGENLGGGQDNAKQLIKELMKSPAHCKNIMDPLYKEVGIAIYIDKNADYKYYWSQNFGLK